MFYVGLPVIIVILNFFQIFLHICKFLDGKQIIDSLKCVCHRFYEILSDDAVWRAWMKERWPELPTSNICYKGTFSQKFNSQPNNLIVFTH